MSHSREISQKQRFEFGKNWARFLAVLNDDRILEAEKSLRDMLGIDHLEGKTFIDVGSGSCLFSLVARRLGAKVHSFDYDPQSVECTKELRRRYFSKDPDWTIEEGSVLDATYISSLGSYDVVYSWGVLHHTGKMWQALDNVRQLVNERGRLFIALYNDQGWISTYWMMVKRLYVRSPKVIKKVLSYIYIAYFAIFLFVADVLRARNPFQRYTGLQRRGMSFTHDVVDWIGGYPFEVSTPEEIVSYFKKHGFSPVTVKSVGRKQGCNQFVFQK